LDLEELCKLLFELSNEDRLNILLELKEAPMKLSHISKKLDFTVQETSRNLSRLSQACLIAKEVDGFFHLTPYGEQALKLLPGFEFLSKHREYFTTHTLSTLPLECAIGIADLLECTFTNDVMVTFHNVENMIREAEEFVWILSDQILVSTLPYLVEALKRGVEFRLILPEDVSPSKSLRERVDNPIFEYAARTKKLESRFLEKVDVFICMSEKEVAALSFPNLDGRLDYLGFRATDERAHKWSKNLISYYWNRASTQIPDHLITG